MAEHLTLDRNAMKDPSTAHLRIYVGGLKEGSTIEGIYEHFQNYGQINGIAINKGFGFVQFENESSVQEAINKANGSVYEGKNLTVRPALTTDKRVEVVHIQPPVPYAVALHGGHDNLVDVADEDDGQYDDYGNYVGEEEEYPPESNFPMLGGGRGRRHRGRSRPRGRGRGGPPPLGFRERSPIGGDWVDRGPYSAPLPPYQRPLPISDRNDCEIIVVSKTLTEYAEYIEGRLKQLGIVVDLLYPMEDVPLGKVLGNIASRGCLYAILVMPANIQHRSLTLSILHGIPQEHRNMKVDDAMSLLARNFEEVKRTGAVSRGREAVFALLGQLADGRSLTAAQYQYVIDYLTERKEKQVKLEEGALVTTAPAVKLEDDLQKRILSILKEKKIGSKDIAPAVAPAPAAAPSSKPALLSDPTVRKALDSVLQKFAG